MNQWGQCKYKWKLSLVCVSRCVETFGQKKCEFSQRKKKGKLEMKLKLLHSLNLSWLVEIEMKKSVYKKISYFWQKKKSCEALLSQSGNRWDSISKCSSWLRVGQKKFALIHQLWWATTKIKVLEITWCCIIYIFMHIVLDKDSSKLPCTWVIMFLLNLCPSPLQHPDLFQLNTPHWRNTLAHFWVCRM